MKLGVALGWHTHAFEDLLALVRRAEALGYRAAYVDGDVSVVPSRGESDVLDGWTVTTALLARTSRIEIGSIRLPQQWNAARLAQAAASLERIAPGRLRFLISIGAQRTDRRFGFAELSPRERIRHLDETLTALRALWAGETVHLQGRYVRLAGAKVRPVPRSGAIPIEIAARRPRLLELVARHADRWDMNVPPLKPLAEQAVRQLELACQALARAPETIARSMWIFTRLATDPAAPPLRAEFRRLNPWFRGLTDEQLSEAIVAGPPETCRRRLAQIQRRFGLELPVLDLSGLARPQSEALLEACAPGESRVDSCS